VGADIKKGPNGRF
jgi:hypothetical protein